MAHPVPENERDRLAALSRYGVVGTPPEMDFDEIARFAARICDCPVAVVNLIADRWEWYKGKCGIPADVNREPRGGICSTTICSNDLLIVPDLAEDARFADHPVVAEEPHFRFYAGAPLINPDGFALGSLCVLDFAPRQITPEQKQMLRWLTAQAVAQLELRRKVAELEQTRQELAEEKQKADDLIRNILPDDIAEELKRTGQVTPRYHEAVTILFTDFKSFTQLAERMEPRALIEELHDHFSTFDEIVTRHGLEKLKTIGDAYMCAAGLAEKTATHAEDCCRAALDIRDYMDRVNRSRIASGLPPWEIRIGLHSGGVIAGVVGTKKFEYDIWGDAVNVAALMEAQAEPGQILLSDVTFGLIRDRFETEFGGEVDSVKKGHVRYHVLKGPKGESG